MDPELLRQKQAFSARLISQPVVETDRRTSSPVGKPKTSSSSKPRPLKSAAPAKFDYKTTSTSSSSDFNTLSKIIDYLKTRHLEQKHWSLSLDEIVQELYIHNITTQTMHWLEHTALPHNERVLTDADGKFSYNPPYKVRGKNSLLTLLKKYKEEGRGALLVSLLNDSMANVDKALEAMGDDVIELPTTTKKKDRALFYCNPADKVEIDPEFVKLWRTINLEHIDENKIEAYLQKEGIATMSDPNARKRVLNGADKNKNKMRKRRANQRIDNVHMAEAEAAAAKEAGKADTAGAEKK